MKKTFLLLIGFSLAAGCRGPTVNVAPIKIEPIHITMDINIKVDKQLDSFFDFEDDLASAPAPTPAP